METEPIIIRIQAIDEATSKISSIADSLNELNISTTGLSTGIKTTYTQIHKISSAVDVFKKEMDSLPVENIENLEDKLRIAGLSIGEFNSYLARNHYVLYEGEGIYDQLTGRMMSYGEAIRRATYGLRRFKFEWLSIMFAGMALERVFNGMIKSQMDLYGVTQSTSDMWTDVMSSVMVPLTDKIYDLQEAIMSLPSETKTIISIGILGGDVLGASLKILGEIFLASQGLKMLFPGLTAEAIKMGGGISGAFLAIKGAVIGVISGISVTFLAVAAVIVAAVVGIYIAWKENFMGIRDAINGFIDGVKQAFKGLINIFKGVWEIIKGLFTGNGDLVVEGLKKIFKGFFDFILGSFKMTLNLVVSIGIGVLRVILGIIQGIINTAIAAYDKISRLLGGKGTSFRVDWIDQLKVPSFQTGGIMPYTGLAYLHAGERIIPKEKSESNIVVNNYISAEIASSYDVRKLADDLNKYLGGKIR